MASNETNYVWNYFSRSKFRHHSHRNEVQNLLSLFIVCLLLVFWNEWSGTETTLFWGIFQAVGEIFRFGFSAVCCSRASVNFGKLANLLTCLMFVLDVVLFIVTYAITAHFSFLVRITLVVVHLDPILPDTLLIFCCWLDQTPIDSKLCVRGIAMDYRILSAWAWLCLHCIGLNGVNYII